MRFSVLLDFFSVLPFWTILSTVLRFLMGLNAPSVCNFRSIFEKVKFDVRRCLKSLFIQRFALKTQLAFLPGPQN